MSYDAVFRVTDQNQAPTFILLRDTEDGIEERVLILPFMSGRRVYTREQFIRMVKEIVVQLEAIGAPQGDEEDEGDKDAN